jgi:hypothetical protein
MPASFAPGNVAPVSLSNNNINKGRWTQEEHTIFMEEYEKYGNNCTQIAKVAHKHQLKLKNMLNVFSNKI